LIISGCRNARGIGIATNTHIPPPEWPVGGTPAALKLSADKTTLKSVDGTDDAQSS
jgi:hypothetical protein